MKTFKEQLRKIINYIKSIFKRESSKPEPKLEEPIKTEIKRLVYTKRTDK